MYRLQQMQLISLVLLSCIIWSSGRAVESSSTHEEVKLKMIDRLQTGKCEENVQEGDLVTWLSYGSLLSGKYFDVGEYEIKIGNKEAPEGIDQGLRGLCVGDERSLRIQPDLAYGDNGLDNRVPANTSVIYDVKILNIERSSQSRKGLLMNKLLKFEDTNNVEDCDMKVQGDDKINWHYIGTLSNGVGFDTGDFSATIDHGHVITGVNEAMKGLCVGGKRRMVMHHSYAYGPQGRPKIPPYSNLIFDVHLKSIVRPNVGWEDLEIKQRSSHVSRQSPVKITDVTKVGDCDAKINQGSTIKWKGIGYLLTGKIFDEYDVATNIGDGKTLPALRKALIGLCEKDSRSVMIHHELAFGKRGVSNMVPSNATIIYDFTVKEITGSVEL